MKPPTLAPSPPSSVPPSLLPQVIASIVEAHKASTRRGQQLWDKPHLADALADAGATGTRFARSKDEMTAIARHREGYAAVISTQRVAKKNLHLTRKVAEDDVDLGMDTRRCGVGGRWRVDRGRRGGKEELGEGHG